MRSFGTMMPFMGVKTAPTGPPGGPGVSEKVQELFRKFHDIAVQARAIESRIIEMESAGATVPENLYSEYEDMLTKASQAHDLYAQARQELRDLRAERREKRQDLGCA